MRFASSSVSLPVSSGRGAVLVRHLRRPGIEPGSPPWQGGILPLYYRRIPRGNTPHNRGMSSLKVQGY